MVRLAPIGLWLGIWLALSLAFDLDHSLLPGIFSTVPAVGGLLTNAGFIGDLTATLLRVLPGIFFSVLIGVPVGLALAHWRVARLIWEPLFSFFRGVPVATLFPIVIILIGIGEAARILLTIYVTLPIVVVATMTGALERAETKTRRDYLRMHHRRVSHWHFPACLLWDAMPSVLGGLKISLALALVVIIVSEMFFVGGSGAGWYIWDQYQSFNLPNMYAAIFILGVTSFALSALIDIVASRVVR